MSKLLDIFLCGAMTISELIAIFIIAMLIQLIMYRVFNINLYRLFIKGSYKLDKYLSEKF